MSAVFDKQAIFDKVATALIAQGQQASDGTSCRYRHHSGTKCAVGHMLSDEVYDFRMEGKGVLGLVTDWPVAAEALGVAHYPTIGEALVDNDITFLRVLQNAHDQDTSVPRDWRGTWLAEMHRIARNYRLNPAVLDGAWQ